jgi:hypothetical protein
MSPEGGGIMKIAVKEFRRVGWEKTCAEAEAFVNEIGRERIISISHVVEDPYGVVFVWYEDPKPQSAHRARKPR